MTTATTSRIGVIRVRTALDLSNWAPPIRGTERFYADIESGQGRKAMWCRTTIVAATFAISSSGMAAELAKSGSIEGQVYIHTVQKIDELDAPDGMKAYINEEFEFHVPKQRGELLDGMSGRCLAYGKYSDAGAFKESGRCSKVDADGDKIFEEYEAEATGPNDTTPVKVKFVGGTGKYKGIKATLTSTFKPLPALSKTDTMGAAAYKGEYKIGD